MCISFSENCCFVAYK